MNQILNFYFHNILDKQESVCDSDISSQIEQLRVKVAKGSSLFKVWPSPNSCQYSNPILQAWTIPWPSSLYCCSGGPVLLTY